ncbi:hypothetical protein PanWU01x14_102730 [Parasponia andersonii]|uniref:Uncharacterized protein n=1 Tax=Parasponia andersonii TaxID=3476 RepID=A0A2P5D2F7_PARAD|nr:hypothetical protein PanWU01x14_102730 [Parasponia andersonii]
MDPMPPVNKVFSLISQDEHQKKVGVPSSDSANTMAFAAKANIPKSSTSYSGSYSNRGNKTSNYFGNYKGQRKERPFCTHCQFHGHTIDRCYKLHGYPPGYQPRQKDNSNASNNSNSAFAHQASSFTNTPTAIPNDHSSVSNFLQNLDTSQY